MSVVSCPDDLLLDKEQLCAICNTTQPLDRLSVGLRDLEGKQAFACNSHFWESSKLYSGWAAFIAGQRMNMSELDITLESQDAWPVY